MSPIELITKWFQEKFGDDSFHDDRNVAVELKGGKYVSCTYHKGNVVLLSFPQIIEDMTLDLADPELFDKISGFIDRVKNNDSTSNCGV